MAGQYCRATATRRRPRIRGPSRPGFGAPSPRYRMIRPRCERHCWPGPRPTSAPWRPTASSSASPSWRSTRRTPARQRHAPAGLRSALFEVTKTLPGITLTGPATNYAGQTGLGISVPQSGGTKRTMIFDRTGAYIGAKQVVVQTYLAVAAGAGHGGQTGAPSSTPSPAPPRYRRVSRYRIDPTAGTMRAASGQATTRGPATVAGPLVVRWRWRESNPRPPSLQQDFSGRSVRCLYSAPSVMHTSRCDGPSRCLFSHPPPRPRRTVSHLADARNRAGDEPGLTDLLRYLGSESEVSAIGIGAYFVYVAFLTRSATQSSARFSCIDDRSRNLSPPWVGQTVHNTRRPPVTPGRTRRSCPPRRIRPTRTAGRRCRRWPSRRATGRWCTPRPPPWPGRPQQPVGQPPSAGLGAHPDLADVELAGHLFVAEHVATDRVSDRRDDRTIGPEVPGAGVVRAGAPVLVGRRRGAPVLGKGHPMRGQHRRVRRPGCRVRARLGPESVAAPRSATISWK